MQMRQITNLGQEEAQSAIAAIEVEAAKRNKPVVVAVGDAQGELIALLRMDGAPLSSIVIATNKAWTAARERKTSGEVGRKSRDPQSGFDLRNYGDPRYLGWAGGVPVFKDGEVIGAVAVSGLSGSEDEELATLGISAIVM
jgi:glc operon protein GlcG